MNNNYMKDLQYILAHRPGINPSASLDIMLGHVRPASWRIDDIWQSSLVVADEQEEQEIEIKE